MRREAVLAVIPGRKGAESQGRIVGVTRPFTELWATPGGKVEPGESLLAAVAREVREETGVEIRSARRFYSAPFDSKDGANYYVHAFLCNDYLGTPSQQEFGVLSKWVTLDDLLSPKRAAFPEFNERMFAAMLEFVGKGEVICG